jgi:hypothetical protein
VFGNKAAIDAFDKEAIAVDAGLVVRCTDALFAEIHKVPIRRPSW